MRVLLLLATISTCRAGDPLRPYLERSAPRIVRELEPEETAPGVAVRRVVFASATGGEVYALIAAPAGPGTFPGLLVFHGGTGNAAGPQAIDWARRGYIAVAPDLPGIAEPKGAPHSTGAWKSRKYGEGRWSASPDVRSSVIFDAVVVGIESLRLLQDQPHIDRSRIGVMGISWGGYMTTMVAALGGSEIRAAFSIFGCGFYELTSMGGDGPLAKMPEAERAEWIRWLDPGRRAGEIRGSFFIAGATNDFFFWPPAVDATLGAIPGVKNQVFAPNANHKIPLPGGTETGLKEQWIAMVIPYFDHYLKGAGEAFPVVTLVAPKGPGTVRFRAHAVNAAVYWSAAGPWMSRTWTKSDARRIGEDQWEATLPADADAWFALATDARDISVSSRLQSTTRR